MSTYNAHQKFITRYLNDHIVINDEVFHRGKKVLSLSGLTDTRFSKTKSTNIFEIGNDLFASSPNETDDDVVSVCLFIGGKTYDVGLTMYKDSKNLKWYQVLITHLVSRRS